jgi:hypothetical protein
VRERTFGGSSCPIPCADKAWAIGSSMPLSTFAETKGTSGYISGVSRALMPPDTSTKRLASGSLKNTEEVNVG